MLDSTYHSAKHREAYQINIVTVIHHVIRASAPEKVVK